MPFCSTFYSRHSPLLKIVLRSRVGKHFAHSRRVGIGQYRALSEMSFPVGRLLGENVPRECVMTRDLSASCYFEALCRAPVCFEFHFQLSFLPKTFSAK